MPVHGRSKQTNKHRKQTSKRGDPSDVHLPMRQKGSTLLYQVAEFLCRALAHSEQTREEVGDGHHILPLDRHIGETKLVRC